MCACFIMFEISVVLTFRVFCTSQRLVPLDAFSSNDVTDGHVRIKQCIGFYANTTRKVISDF